MALSRRRFSSRVYFGVGRPQPDAQLVFGPNIADWPEQIPLPENLLLTCCAAIYDPVTTTDELIPSGETSSYRSNPIGLSEFTLSRRVPEYVARSKAVRSLEEARSAGSVPAEVLEVLRKAAEETCADKEYQEYLLAQGIDPVSIIGDDCYEMMKADHEMFGTVLAELDL